MSKNIFETIEHNKNNEGAFYGGKEGYDVICFDNNGKIVGSGKKDDMEKIAEKHNYACAYLVPIRFSQP